MASPVILEDVEKVRQLAKLIWYKEVDAIKSINFPSEQERSKYLRDCRHNHNTVEGLLDQGVELQKKYQNDAVRYPIAEDIFLYIVYCANSALQTVRNCTVRKDYLSKISTHVESLIKELGNLNTGNPSDVSTLKEEAAKYKESMLKFINKYRSSASTEFSRWVNQQGLTFDKLVQKYQHIRGLGGLFKDLKEEDKILVYDDIMQASGRGSVIKSWLSKAKSIGGAAVVVITAGLMVWDIYSSDHKIQTATHDAVVSTAAMGGAILGDIIGAAIATDLVGVEATSMFVAMAGFATGLLGAFILAGIAGGLIELIIGSGGTTDIKTDNHKCYVAPMPDGVVLARQIAHN
ncbi:hypothetical protein HYC85_008016 [Camellia sinensis]|uniref:Uncharacterized protein n=1 Tax=Camellia sinensis TaxID=4442 RepID=A0A7J7HQM9_CAMSI|nr:hypothetical protein HYC85_008016 [Camellia sinensis]